MHGMSVTQTGLDGQIGWTVQANKWAKRSCQNSHGFEVGDEDIKNSWFVVQCCGTRHLQRDEKSMTGQRMGISTRQLGFSDAEQVSVPHLCSLSRWELIDLFREFFLSRRLTIQRRWGGRGKLADTANNNWYLASKGLVLRSWSTTWLPQFAQANNPCLDVLIFSPFG